VEAEHLRKLLGVIRSSFENPPDPPMKAAAHPKTHAAVGNIVEETLSKSQIPRTLANEELVQPGPRIPVLQTRHVVSERSRKEHRVESHARHRAIPQELPLFPIETVNPRLHQALDAVWEHFAIASGLCQLQ
jgi:hypothetical protein